MQDLTQFCFQIAETLFVSNCHRKSEVFAQIQFRRCSMHYQTILRSPTVLQLNIFLVLSTDRVSKNN